MVLYVVFKVFAGYCFDDNGIGAVFGYIYCIALP